MAPRKNAREAAASAAASTVPAAAAPVAAPTQTKPKPTAGAATWDKVLQNIYAYYMAETPQRTKLLDVFLAFLAVVGALQFVYCVLAGNYPFNAFLSGFCGTVGQFVLTISLRIQTTTANKSEFPKVSPERAFADYIVCSLILHFFCVNFIN
ncbi:oligosaccharyltransferase complex subunit epsilon [Geosmithia morbida]|uniref:Dolichyl-diphosphooligosaccharide--protein glycosyltransferase subunit OST2 n=1 Tax=Geosmithia morbida TaxID=1094350 RepID=A0A9P4YUP3_9HYPO|nr:oligosaccharyltransferase complex subunit epsilon [Geosmithia morbida]KAF4123441.1 oligosaccharyltransferase complex subunit epsilon [Geosmithia morbida]